MQDLKFSDTDNQLAQHTQNEPAVEEINEKEKCKRDERERREDFETGEIKNNSCTTLRNDDRL